MKKYCFLAVFILFFITNGFTQLLGIKENKSQLSSNLTSNNLSTKTSLFETDPDAPLVGPSFEVFACKMRNKSLNNFITTYNQSNAGQLTEEMKSLGTMFGIRYGFTFSVKNNRDLNTLFYIGQQIFSGSLEAKLIDGYTRKIDFRQKNVLDLAIYFPINKYLYIGTKLGWASQTMDAYRVYGVDRVYDEQSFITGIYRSSIGNFTTGLELKANFTLFKKLVISPSIAYQSTFGNGASSHFTKGADQWNENSSPVSYDFPSDYNGYLTAISNYNVLPAEGLLKPRNRMVKASVSVLINLSQLFR